LGLHVTKIDSPRVLLTHSGLVNFPAPSGD